MRWFPFRDNNSTSSSKLAPVGPNSVLVTSGAAGLQQLKDFTAGKSLVDGLVSASTVALNPVVGLCRPQGPGTCDHNRFERVCNVITSLPFLALGLHTLLTRQTPEGRFYGASVIGVGAGAIAFHATSGDVRHWTRKLDYWCISLSTISLVRAVQRETPPLASLAAAVAVPFQPFMVSSLNAAVVEAEYLKRAAANPTRLKRAHRLHLAATALGGACFFAEDLHPTLPLVHTVWHGLSALGVATLSPLLAAVENDAAARSR